MLRPAAPCRRNDAAASDGAARGRAPRPSARRSPDRCGPGGYESAPGNFRRERQTTPTSLLGAYWCVPCVTIGVTAKFSVGGGDGISHSRPLAPHGFAGAGFPLKIEYVK